MTMSFFEGMHGKRTQSVLNVLLETPFFYPEDDPELFAFLRRHRVEITRFFAEVFDWELVVEPRVARVHKAHWHNASVTRTQRSPFEPTRKGDCLALLLLLDLHERRTSERQSHPQDASPIRFSMGELLEHAGERMGELGLADRYDADAIRDLYRSLVPVLLLHRFVREIDDAGGCTYEALAGLALYDARALSDEALREAFVRPSTARPS